MKNSAEHELDRFIDALNQEHAYQKKLDKETREMVAVVRGVKSLRQPAAPSPDFGSRVYDSFRVKSPRRRLGFIPAVALVAGLLLFALFTTWSGPFNRDVVYAMGQAVARLSNYHGVMEMSTRNAAGEEWMVSKVEMWSEGEKYAVRLEDGTATVNNGEKRWQVRPGNKEVALLPLVPDPQRNGFDLRDEAEKAKQYPHAVIGQEIIAEREAIKLQISPPGGRAYFLWIDAETSLPVQLQTPMQNALLTTYTFVNFEPNTVIDANIFTYRPPGDYKVVAQGPGQQVADIGEAVAISGLIPMVPQESPDRIFAFQNRIVLDYGDTSIMETIKKESFEIAGNGAQGTAAGGPLEVVGDQLRWRQEGVEILIEGARRVTLARQIAPDLALPDTGQDLAAKAQKKVSVELESVQNDQQQVDGGHSPWQLDPLQVAHTFVNFDLTLDLTLGGIQKEPQIEFPALSLVVNNGVEAEVEIAGGAVKKIYLKRLVRQDETGIWSVVGYDMR